MRRTIARLSFTLFLVIPGFFGKIDTAKADIRVYRDGKGVLYITNNSVQTVSTRKASKASKASKVSGPPFAGRLIDVKKELAERNTPGRFVHDPQTKAAIHVYRDKQGTLLFTNVPNRPGYRPFLLLNTYSRRLGGRESVTFDRLIQAACQRYGVEF